MLDKEDLWCVRGSNNVAFTIETIGIATGINLLIIFSITQS